MGVQHLVLSSATAMYRESRFFKFCYVPATITASSKGILVAATKSTNQTY